MRTYIVTLSAGPGCNYEIEVEGRSQSDAKDRAERMTGDKAIRATY